MLPLSALSVRLKSNITADPLSKGKSGLRVGGVVGVVGQTHSQSGREREKLKVSAADSIEGNKKLKCLAISAKRVKTPVSTHLNVFR